VVVAAVAVRVVAAMVVGRIDGHCLVPTLWKSQAKQQQS
jgi:hypothetical protein